MLASEPEIPNSYWFRSGPAVAAVDPAASMSSRAAENLFWLGRYAERAEDLVRLVRVVNDRRNEFEHGANPAGTVCLRVLLAALTHTTTTYPGFVGEGGDRLERAGRRAAIAAPRRAATRHPGSRRPPPPRLRLRRTRPVVGRHLDGHRRAQP